MIPIRRSAIGLSIVRKIIEAYMENLVSRYRGIVSGTTYYLGGDPGCHILLAQGVIIISMATYVRIHWNFCISKDKIIFDIYRLWEELLFGFAD